MSSLLRETTCRPRISPICHSDSRLSFVTGSLEPFSAPWPPCRCTTKNLPSRRQELKSSRRISGYAPITSLRISFGTPSIPDAVFALSLPPALFSSSRVKSSSRRTMQELRSCLWDDCTCGNKLCTMYLTRSALSRPGIYLLVTSLLVTMLKARPHGSFSTSQSSLSSTEVGFSLFHASELILLLSMPRAAEDHPLSG